MCHLQVLVESSYSGQFGTFLLNNEQERHKVCITPTSSKFLLALLHTLIPVLPFMRTPIPILSCTHSAILGLQTFSDEAHKHKSVATHTLSFWTWVAMVNAAGRTFYNHLYDPQTFPW